MSSVSLCHALVQADLVDEYRLFVYPVVVGRGRHLFGSAGPTTRAMDMVDAQRFESGIILLRYCPV